MQLKIVGVKLFLYSNWAVARNYEEMMDIYLKGFPDTPVETIQDVANKGF